MGRRIELFDLWRSFAIVLMVCYHLLYDLYLFGVIDHATLYSDWAYAIRYAAAGSFMLISGAVVCRSRSCIRRGAIVFCWGMVVSVAMRFVGMRVQFGVLHHLGTMMIAYGLISKKIKPPKGIWFLLISIMIFAVTWYIGETVRVEDRWLFPIGLRFAGFTSADYYPLLPWGMIFGIGVWLGKFLEKWRDSPLLTKKFHPALTIAGRHSLAVYIVHQPLLYGLCWLAWH